MSLFEGRIRNFANKKVVTAAEALLLSTTACEKPKEKTISEDNKKIEITNDPEYYRQQYIEYMEHPSYKERLAREMYGDQVIDEEKQKNVDREYDKRRREIKKISIKMLPSVSPGSYDPSVAKYEERRIETTPEAFYHEMSHELFTKPNEKIMDQGFQDAKRKFIDEKKLIEQIIEIEREKLNSKEISPEANDILHRKFIIVLKKKKLFEKLNKSSGKDYDDILRGVARILLGYYESNTEIIARLTHLRLKAINEYGLNQNEEFDISKFKKLKEDKQYIELRVFLHLSDEQINELMKYTAFNNPKNIFYPPGSDEEKFKKGYHIPGIEYGEEEGQA